MCLIGDYRNYPKETMKILSERAKDITDKKLIGKTVRVVYQLGSGRKIKLFGKSRKLYTYIVGEYLGYSAEFFGLPDDIYVFLKIREEDGNIVSLFESDIYNIEKIK